MCLSHNPLLAGSGNDSYSDVTLTAVLDGPYMLDTSATGALLQISTIYSPVPMPGSITIVGGDNCIGVFDGTIGLEPVAKQMLE